MENKNASLTGCICGHHAVFFHKQDHMTCATVYKFKKGKFAFNLFY